MRRFRLLIEIPVVLLAAVLITLYLPFGVLMTILEERRHRREAKHEPGTDQSSRL
jgi:hypothetical protein